MKKALFSLLILVAGNSAVAAVEHKNCKIASNYNYSAPQMPGIEGRGDWSSRGSIDRQFESLGYMSTGSKNYKEIKDGDLYTSAVLVYGGASGSQYFAYISISIKRKDLSIKGPDPVLAQSSSNESAEYVNDMDYAIARAWNEAINQLPSCRVQSDQAAQ